MTSHRRHGLESFLACPSSDSNNAAGVSIEVVSDAGYVNLRGSPDNAEFIETATTVLGQDLPLTANRMTKVSHRIFWLGPDEWLIVTPAETTLTLIKEFDESLSTRHASLTNVSGGQILLRATGTDMRNVLAKGCTLDFHPSEFKVGDCTQSGLAKANVLIALVDEQPTFEIIVHRSFAEYLARWLRHSAGEYGVDFFAGSLCGKT